jgi:mannosyltransferase
VPRATLPLHVESRSSASRTAPPSRWRDPLILGAVAAVVASLGSWIPSKWNDEAATQTAATRSLAELWKMMHNIDAVHGAYYAFMHFWILAFGTSNLALRAPSMIAVGIACAGVVILGKRLGSRRIAIWSALVFMILPRVTWLGIEARSYAFTAMVAVWLTIVLVRIVDRRRPRWWALYAALAAVGVILNVYIALLVVAHGVTLVLARRSYRRPRWVLLGWTVAAASAAILASPIAMLVMGQSRQLPFGRPTVTGVADMVLFEQYFTGATPTLGRYVPIPPTSVWALAAVLLACLGWALMIAVVSSRRIRARSEGPSSMRLVAVTVPWIVVPLVVLLGFSLAVTPIYTARYFSFTTPAVALLIGTFVAALSTRWKRAALFGTIAVLALPIYLSQREPTSKNGTDWQQAASVLQHYAKPGQDIYYGPVRPGSTLSVAKIQDAYPAVISQLHNITLKATGTQTNTLWDSQWPLAHARSTLQKTGALWVVLAHSGVSSPATTNQQKYFESNGLHLARAWRGTATDVLLFTR